MATTAREDLLAAGLAVFDRDGFEGATVAAIRTRARAPNGSFFHFFGSKKELAGTLFLQTLERYHAAVLAAVSPSVDQALSALAQLKRAAPPATSARLSDMMALMRQLDEKKFNTTVDEIYNEVFKEGNSAQSSVSV